MTEARKTGGFSFFTLWFGAAVSLAEIMTGSLIAPLGLKQGLFVILAGHLIGALILALVGVIGFREKSPSLKSSRLSLGRYGSYIISVFNIIQLIGWTAIMLIQSSRALQSITGKLFGFDNFYILVVITGVLVVIWALNTENAINTINHLAVGLLLVLCLVMLKSVMTGNEMKDITSNITFGAALELSIIMPLTWLPLISDYTMLGKSARGSFWGSFGGYFIGSSFMYVIGLVSSIYAGTPDPIGVLTGLNLGFSALLVVLLSTVTTTFLDVYSAVMSTLNLTLRITKKKLILIFGALGMLLAMYFPMEHYEHFLYMIGSLFAPVFSVVMADYFVYKENRSAELLNVPGLAAAAVGVASYYMVIEQNLVIGATIPSMMITMVVYALFRIIKKAMPIKEEEKYARQNS